MRDDRPQVLVFPAWRDNPFLNVMSLAARADGFRFIGATSFASLLASMHRLGAGDILHVHWTSPVLQADEVTDATVANGRLRAFENAADEASARGVRLVWTIHNRLPHELRFRDEEIALCRFLADHADRVHVMSPATIEVMSEIASIDSAKVTRIPHPSYAGLYETGQTREEARGSFGLGPDDFAVLFLGQIRPYKGVGDLLEAIDLLSERTDREPVLLLAGGIVHGAEEKIRASLPRRARAITQFTFVNDGEIARWFSAADVAVFPYRAILNSGSVHLAATFGVPVVIPDEPHLREEYRDQAWVTFFDSNDPAVSIARALSDWSRFADAEAGAFEAFLRPIGPWATSRTYLELLRELSAVPAEA